MAKPLAVRPPSSAIARLFDPDAAVRAALSPMQQPAAALPPAVHPRDAAKASDHMAATAPSLTGEPAVVKRELVLTPSADAALTHLVNVFRTTTGTKLTTSHVARAILHVVAACLPQIERQAASLSHCTLPSNAKGREADRDAFERRIASAFQAGVASASRPDSV